MKHTALLRPGTRLFAAASLALALLPAFSRAETHAEKASDAAVQRVILFERTLTGGHPAARRHLREALERLAAKQGFGLQVTADPADLNDRNLLSAQVLVLGNGDGDVVPAGAARAAVEKFVREDGKGLLVVHAGAAFIREWSFLAEGVGRQYDHHAPATTRATVFLDTGSAAAPGRSPLAQRIFEGLPERAELTEEFYGFSSSPRGLEGVTVLLALDEASALPPLAARLGDHPLVWTRAMGRGHVLTHTLGHNRGAFTGADSLGQRLLWNEIRFLAGGGGCAEALCKGALSLAASSTLREPEIRLLKRTLSIRLPDEGTHHARVLDVAGKSVFARAARGGEALSVPGLKSGSYLVRVKSSDGRVTRHRVLVP